MGEQSGIPLFYLQGQGVLKATFMDRFGDASLYWGWRKHLGLTPANKSGVEADGTYQLQCNGTINGDWDAGQNEAPKIFIGLNGLPCEVTTRLDYFTGNDKTQAGLFISKSPLSFGANVYLGIMRKIDGGTNGIVVTDEAGANLALFAHTTLPIWLRMRIGCTTYNSLHIFFDYSTDGTNWTELYSWAGTTKFPEADACAGLLVTNDSVTKNLILGKFDYFKMKEMSIN